MVRALGIADDDELVERGLRTGTDVDLVPGCRGCLVGIRLVNLDEFAGGGGGCGGDATVALLGDSTTDGVDLWLR